jgi:hypothetical protein
MIQDEMLKALKERYKIHPLLFQRSKERAKTAGDLFDILDTIPKDFPITWNEDLKKWLQTKDLFQVKAFPKD